MDDDTSVRILLGMIFDKQVLGAEEMIARNPSIPTCLLTEDIIRSTKNVLRIRSSVVLYRWKTFFDTCYKMMLSSHEMYLTFVMFACISEHKSNQNIFESFISVCALAKRLSNEILQKTGVNLCDLNPDIVTVFYQYQLKGMFCESGGFQRLVEYIRKHRYLKWKLSKHYYVSNDTSTDLIKAIKVLKRVKAIETDFDEKLEKELRRERVIEKKTNPDEASRDTTSIFLAKEVLSTTLVELPTLTSLPDLVKSLIAYRKKKITENSKEKRRTEADEKLQASNVALPGCSSSNSESTTNYDAKRQENFEWNENIIQAVIRHNHSKSSGHEKANKRIQEEAEGVLEHLKDTIKSLIEVLNEYDKE
ncbi:hypothetical protein AVEN_57836-1 [Araneus ventricosus]|uniref:Uncharacterized protein n=1 Tax=Araneus ventricosus TaxID=182803 RepID=A0A4Y2I9E0_ARAVE|nr:hypothetical protein AVEN_57836-1 [Araneus ventricosus]